MAFHRGAVGGIQTGLLRISPVVSCVVQVFPTIIRHCRILELGQNSAMCFSFPAAWALCNGNIPVVGRRWQRRRCQVRPGFSSLDLGVASVFSILSFQSSVPSERKRRTRASRLARASAALIPSLSASMPQSIRQERYDSRAMTRSAETTPRNEGTAARHQEGWSLSVFGTAGRLACGVLSNGWSSLPASACPIRESSGVRGQTLAAMQALH